MQNQQKVLVWIRVAMLSFSTKGSAKSDDVEKVANAVKLAQEKWNLKV